MGLCVFFLISDKFTSTIIKMKYVFLLSLLVATILANPVPADDEMVEITADVEMPEITADVVDSTMEGSELRARNPKPAGGNKNAAGKPKPAGGNKNAAKNACKTKKVVKVAEQPRANKPKAVANKPKPAGQKPKPAGQNPKPAGQKPKPAGQKPKPAVKSGEEEVVVVAEE